MKKIKNIVFGIIYYGLLIPICVQLFIAEKYSPIIKNSSYALFVLTIIIVPFLFFLFPLFLIKHFNKKPSESFVISFVSLILYIVILWTYSALIMMYSISFTRENWEKHLELRKYMIAEIEHKYNLVGMNKNEIINLLGEPYETNVGICYYTGVLCRQGYYFCLTYDKQEIITRTYSYFDDDIKFYNVDN